MKIGKYEFEKPLALAPMEDVTDYSFRMICKNNGADLLYTEFANCEAIVRDAKKTLRKLDVRDEERPIGIQLYGRDEDNMEAAARIAQDSDPDFIDINCGCWVRKVAMRGDGAGLLRDINKMGRVVQSVINGTSLPVTVKTRLGWDAENIVILDVARMLEDMGVQMLAVHCRTRSQAHSGDVDWSWLEKLKNTVNIPIIGNGDVLTPQDAKRMFDTGCDGVMIGRGVINNPWLFKQCRHYIDTGDLLPEPDIRERIALCIEHFKMSVIAKDGLRGVREFRKHFSGYLRGLPHVSKLRSELVRIDEEELVIERLNRFADEYEAANPQSE